MRKSLILIMGFLMVMLPARAQPTVEGLSQRTIHRRAVEAVIWGMPAVNAQPRRDLPGARQAVLKDAIGEARA